MWIVTGIVVGARRYRPAIDAGEGFCGALFQDTAQKSTVAVKCEAKASVDEIVNMVCIAVVDAQERKKNKK